MLLQSVCCICAQECHGSLVCKTNEIGSSGKVAVDLRMLPKEELQEAGTTLLLVSVEEIISICSSLALVALISVVKTLDGHL